MTTLRVDNPFCAEDAFDRGVARASMLSLLASLAYEAINWWFGGL